MSSPRKPLSSGGDSESWVKSKSNQLRIADLFLGWLGIPPEQRNLWGAVWDRVPEEHLGDPEIWGWLLKVLGSYLVADDGYKIEPPHARAGKPLMMSTALSIWGGVVKQTSETIKKSKSSKHDTKVRAVRALPLILCRAAARCLHARVLISSALTCASACLHACLPAQESFYWSLPTTLILLAGCVVANWCGQCKSRIDAYMLARAASKEEAARLVAEERRERAVPRTWDCA